MEKEKAEAPDKCPMDFTAKKEEYCSMKESGYTKVIECEDQEFESEEVYQGTHKMGPSELNCLVYELERASYPTFFLLRDIRHPSIVRHEIFLEKSGNLKVVILSHVDCKLEDLVTPDKASMFFTSSEGRSGLTTSFRTMILDACCGLEHLLKLGLYPKQINLTDLYICKDGPTKKRVQLLILEAKKINRERAAEARRASLWEQMRLIVEKIRTTTKSGELNEVDKRFVKCIGNCVNMLSMYPHSWSYEEKGCYLISLISANSTIVSDMLKTSDLKWPDAPDIPHLLELLIKNASKRPFPYPYSTEDPYDYVLMCRVTFKHLPSLRKEVPELAEACTNRDDFLKLMEKWQPLIWCMLYDAIGLTSSLPTSTSNQSNSSA